MASGIASVGLGLRFSFSVPGVESLTVDLSRFANEITDYRPFWSGPFLDVWRPWMIQAFQTQGSSTGPAWAPLSPRYAAWRERHGYGGQGILVRSGQLSSSLINPERSALGIFESAPSSLRLGSRRQGALFHQLGTRRMPARPPIRPTPEFMVQVGKALQVYAAKAWSARRQSQFVFSGT
jgi:Phage virion morphogenesis family